MISQPDLTVNFIDGQKHVSDRRAIMHTRGVKNVDARRPADSWRKHTYLNVTTASIATHKITRVGAIVRTNYARRINNILESILPLLYLFYCQ